MSRVYAKTRRTLLYIFIILVGAFTLVSFTLAFQESKITANKDRNALFHVPSILHASNAEKLILRSREPLLIAIKEAERGIQGQPREPKLQPAQGFQPFQSIRNDYDRIMELQAKFGGGRYEATLQKINAQYAHLTSLENAPAPELRSSILSMQNNLARLDNLYLSFNQLERLHVGSYEELDRLIGLQLARKNLISIPGSIIILLCALATIAFLASKTKKALELQERSEDELQSLNMELEQRIVERTKSLAQSRETYKTLFEQAPIAYYNVGPGGEVRQWNKAAERLFGVTGKDLQGKNISDFYHPALLEKARDLSAQFAAGKGLHNEEMTYVRPNGEKSYGLLSVTPIFDDDGNVVESLSMDVDITELREAQDRVSSMQRELVVKERLAAIGQVTASVSHELRNPLGAIRSATDALRRLVGDENNQVERAFALLERSQLRCLRIIGELLDFTRVQALELRATQVDTWLSHLLDDCDIPPQVEVHLELGFQADLAIDRERMEQVVRNVVDNACHAMNSDADGEPIGHNHELIIKTRLADQRFELSIKDTGCGIQHELKTKIFEPLFTTKSYGVGLGLPIVRQIMEQHRGGVTITGAPGQGAEVVLWMPASTQKTSN